MPDQGFHLRPDTDRFEWFGAHATIIDPAGLLAAARTGHVELLDSVAFPAPVRRVRFGLRCDSRNGQRVHLIEAVIRSAGVADGPASWLILGAAGPVGLLLLRRLGDGDPAAGRVAAGAGRVVAEATRRLGLT
ncbi:MAG TPA: hypothetical protein VF462_10340, partial [Micromonosporaceae bacterium]